MIKLDNTLRRTIKAQARLRILSRLPVCVLAAVVYMLPAVFIGVLTSVPMDAGLMRIVRMLLINLVCEVVILGPIMLGIQYTFVQVARGQTPEMQGIFAPLGDVREMFRGMRMMLCMGVRVILLALIPTVLYEAAVYFVLNWMDAQGMNDFNSMMRAVGLLIIVYCLMLLPAVGLGASYWMGYSALHDDPSIGVWRATKEGAKLLRGQRWQMIVFTVSFLPWFIAGLFTCGILSGFGMIYLCVSLYCLRDRLEGRQQPEVPPML
ncbi:MAG: DUF975 family protein [Butyricicoccus sp.]|nr:DUF975 family protein [Butyricicoccus sp.]